MRKKEKIWKSKFFYINLDLKDALGMEFRAEIEFGAFQP